MIPKLNKLNTTNSIELNSININNLTTKGLNMSQFKRKSQLSSVEYNNMMHESLNTGSMYTNNGYDGNFDSLTGTGTKSAYDDGASHVLISGDEDTEIVEADAKAEAIYNTDWGVIEMRKRWLNYYHNETVGGVNPRDAYLTKLSNKGVTMYDRENRSTQYWLGQMKVCNNLEWLGRIVNKAKAQGITLRSNINALNQAYKVTKARLEYRNAYTTSRFIANRKSYTYYPDTKEYANVIGSF